MQSRRINWSVVISMNKFLVKTAEELTIAESGFEFFKFKAKSSGFLSLHMLPILKSIHARELVVTRETRLSD